MTDLFGYSMQKDRSLVRTSSKKFRCRRFVSGITSETGQTRSACHRDFQKKNGKENRCLVSFNMLYIIENYSLEIIRVMLCV